MEEVMMKFGSGLLLATVLLSGCAGFNGQPYVDKANVAEPTGSAFAMALAKEYKALANFEWNDMADYRDGKHYAKKSIAAATGEVVVADEVGMRDLPEFALADLSDAYGRLNAVLDSGSRERAPELSAKAQAMFDCWMEQQEENHQPEHIAACRKDFDEIMAQLGPSKYLVFFDFNSSNLTRAAKAIIKQAVADGKSRGVTSFAVVGHTDTSGSNKYNDALSMARAKAVKSALIAYGVKAGKVSVEAKGESTPLEATADGVKSPTNRRAEVMYR
jgi:OOP family OmpA-OmpF porin